MDDVTDRKHSAVAARKASPTRPEIQALRAIAVSLVVAFHLAPESLTGGFIGVDVFFVISGFLITSHLLREVETSGRIQLLKFWSRRARRLLPASILVLLVTAATVLVAVPQHLWRQYLTEIGASALYVQNWVLAASSVDYMASANAASPVQHFWSLSAEEQFYIALPIVMALTVLVAGRVHTRRAVFIVLGAIAGASLICSVLLTTASPTTAYFITPTRAWEFLAGGLLAFAPAIGRAAARGTATWVGLGLIATAAVAFNDATPFPGYLAVIPVVGAALVIAGEGTAVSRVFNLRAVQYLGDISYSVYLWHWPLIALIPVITGTQIGLRAGALVVLATLALAALTKRFVEDPLRRPRSRERLWPVFASVLASASLVVAVSATGIAVQNAEEYGTAAAVQALQDENPDCFAAAAIANDCAEQPLVTDPAFASTDFVAIGGSECPGGTLVSPIGDAVECSYGDPDATTRIVLIGDSHAGQWMPALDEVAKERGWQLTTLVRSSCPFGDLAQTRNGLVDTPCITWRDDALSRILELKPSAVFATSLGSYGYELLDFSIGSIDEQEAGFRSYFTTLLDNDVPVFVLRDTPYLAVAGPDCLAAGDECVFARSDVLDNHPDSQWAAAQATDGVALIDLLPYICHPETCPDDAGGVIIYRDRHHLTQTYSRSLAPYLDAAIGDLLPR